MARPSFDLGDFSVMSGQKSYDIDLEGDHNHVELSIFTDALSVLFAIGPESAVPFSVGTSHKVNAVFKRCRSFRLEVPKISTWVGYNVLASPIRNGQKVDPTRLVVPVEMTQAVGMTQTVRAMVRAQLMSYGINVDGDVRDFADGDLSFDDDGDDFGGSGFYDDDPEPDEPSPAPVPPKPSETPPQPEGSTEPPPPEAPAS